MRRLKKQNRKKRFDQDTKFIHNFGRSSKNGQATFTKQMSKGVGKAETNRYHHLDNMGLWD